MTSDGFAGLRAMLGRRQDDRDPRRRPLVAARRAEGDAGVTPRRRGRALRRGRCCTRYGIVFRRLLTRDVQARRGASCHACYRRLEARGEIRGGRFVHGMSGEQFALPDAIQLAREIRRTPASAALLTISGADPLNLVGIVTGDERVPAVARDADRVARWRAAGGAGRRLHPPAARLRAGGGAGRCQRAHRTPRASRRQRLRRRALSAASTPLRGVEAGTFGGPVVISIVTQGIVRHEAPDDDLD